MEAETKRLSYMILIVLLLSSLGVLHAVATRGLPMSPQRAGNHDSAEMVPDLRPVHGFTAASEPTLRKRGARRSSSHV
jgi:hypothetical protein